jgi:DNA repair exonuclease SbcCD ATPase subunit
MIVFKKIRWKNFLSTGNSFSEIDISKSQTSLIIGSNGSGKSTVLDALTFSLFGKPFRKINKPQLPNTINEKDCVVEVIFSIGKNEWKVTRGIKPSIFEIYKNGELLDQQSDAIDQQRWLEQNVLKMNYKSFTQIVILGSAAFTPFMQLSPGDRRAVIEDLLDIQIFSTMNVIVKQRLMANRDAIERNRLELAGKEEKKSFITKTLTSLKTNNEERLAELQKQHNDLTQQKKELLEKVQSIADEKSKLVDEVSDVTDLRKTYEKSIK